MEVDKMKNEALAKKEGEVSSFFLDD